MSFRALSADFSVTGQIAVDDLPGIARAGFRSIVCNRPDREAPDQPDFGLIEEAAVRAGLQARHLPAHPGQVTPEHGEALARLLETLPGPVLAYCRSGARSASMWHLAQAARSAPRRGGV